MDDFGSWGQSGMPDVLPTGYGETPMDRGGPNIGPGTGNSAEGPGWMTAGTGTPEYMGATDEKKKSVNWQPRDATGPDGSVFRQYPDGSLLIMIAKDPSLRSLAGKTITQQSHPQQWAAITGAIGPWKPPVLAALLQTAAGVANAAVSPPPRPRYRPSGRATLPTAPPETGVPWGYIGGGLLLMGLVVGGAYYFTKPTGKKE